MDKVSMPYIPLFFPKISNRMCSLVLIYTPSLSVLIRLDGMLTKINSNIDALYNLDPPPLFNGEQSILITSPELGTKKS